LSGEWSAIKSGVNGEGSGAERRAESGEERRGEERREILIISGGGTAQRSFISAISGC
jgi:hypothetical protein